MPVRGTLCLNLVWGLLLAAGACGGRAGDTGATGATSQGGNSGVATSLASGGSSSMGGATTTGGATLVTGGSPGCHGVYGLGGINGIEACGWGCTNDCKNYAPCGDGIVQADCGEICNDGVNSGYPGSCSPDCKTPRCGDGMVQPENGEECDVGAEDASARPWPHCELCQNVYRN